MADAPRCDSGGHSGDDRGLGQVTRPPRQRDAATAPTRAPEGLTRHACRRRCRPPPPTPATTLSGVNMAGMARGRIAAPPAKHASTLRGGGYCSSLGGRRLRGKGGMPRRTTLRFCRARRSPRIRSGENQKYLSCQNTSKRAKGLAH